MCRVLPGYIVVKLPSRIFTDVNNSQMRGHIEGIAESAARKKKSARSFILNIYGFPMSIALRRRSDAPEKYKQGLKPNETERN